MAKSVFRDIADIDYPIIDADAHVNEPPDLWQDRVPARLRDRAPKVVHTDDGDWWSFDDGKRMRPLGFTAVAGLSYLDSSEMGGASYVSPAKTSDPTIEAIKNGRFEARRTGRLGLALIEGHADDERFA